MNNFAAVDVVAASTEPNGGCRVIMSDFVFFFYFLHCEPRDEGAGEPIYPTS